MVLVGNGGTFHAAVSETLNSLSEDRPIFHSEADFQHAFALQFHKLEPSSQVRLERPVRLPEIPVVNVDLLIQLGENRYACELKYITQKVMCSVRGEEFHLKAQGAQDLRRYDILKDVVRVETLVKHNEVQAGCSLTLTNDATLWEPASRPGTIDQMFRLSEGLSVTGELIWSSHAASGTIRGRAEPLLITGTHILNWLDYSDLGIPRNGRFRALHIPIG